METLAPYLLVVITLLGSPVYRVRMLAFNHLSRMDSIPIRLLMESEKHPDKEISSRSKLIVDRWFERNAEKIVANMKPKGWDVYPWICTKNEDGEWSYFPTNGYMESLREEKFHDSGPNYPMWSEGTRRYLVDLVRQRIDTALIIEAFCEKHREWCRDHGLIIPPE